MSHMMVSKDPIIGLNYISKRQLASVYTNCLLVNGYSGYEPPEQTEYYNEINEAILAENKDEFLNSLKKRDVSFIRITPELIVADKKDAYLDVFNKLVLSKEIAKMSKNLFMVKVP